MNIIEARLGEIRWCSASAITSEAESLIASHVARTRRVINHLQRTQGRPPLDAYADAQSAGYQADEYEAFLHMSFTRVNYRPARAKEPLALTIASYYFWQDDPDMGHLPNPWEPLMRLYEAGYTTTFEQDDAEGRLELVVEYDRGQQRNYPILSGGGA